MGSRLCIGWLIVLWWAVILRSFGRGQLDSGQFGGIGDPSSALHAGCWPKSPPPPVSVGLAKPLAGAIRTPLAFQTACHLFDRQNVHRIPSGK